MMSARSRAEAIAFRFFGGGWSRATFNAMMVDGCEHGSSIRKLVDAIEEGIEIDRLAHAADIRLAN